MLGVFDSGVGGLSVWRELAALLPDAPMMYLADQAHVPYGPRPPDEVRRLTERCARWLIDRGCTVVVIACNTASGAALDALRAAHPATHFVGAEPAIKPAALHTRSGIVGVLATQSTLSSARYASLLARFAGAARVLEQPCPEWVTLVEAGDALTPRALPIIDARLRPLLDAGADVLVLGCTHFPFLLPPIHTVLDARAVQVIDPSPAIAREAARWYDGARLFEPRREFWTTGDPAHFSQLASALLGEDVQGRRVKSQSGESE
ncbi:MAG: glutamate racemase [Chloroflexi bacterium]|nr:glutamate racemase [Chloroflexota bacterium]